jgi:hypothetical protein
MTETFNEDVYIDDVLNKSIFDYLNEKQNNKNKLYEKQLEVLKNTKIKDIRLQCFTDNNGNVLTFDIYTNNNEDCKIDSNIYKYQKLEDLKWILKNAKSYHIITCRINEIIRSHYCRNIQSSYLYDIKSDDLLNPIDINVQLLDQYEQIKQLLAVSNCQDKINEDLILKTKTQAKQIKDLLLKTNSHDDIIEDLLVNYQELVIKLEEQEKQIKDLKLNTSKIESLEKLVLYNESKNHYKFIYFFYTFIVCLVFKMI